MPEFNSCINPKKETKKRIKFHSTAIEGNLIGGPVDREVTLHLMFASSAKIGDRETFATQELVCYIDSLYRSIPNRESRGLAGHSMGGNGTLRLVMKNPDVYSVIYALGPCCMDGAVSSNPELIK